MIACKKKKKLEARKIRKRREEEVQEGHFETREKMAKVRPGLSVTIQFTYRTITCDYIVKYTLA